MLETFKNKKNLIVTYILIFSVLLLLADLLVLQTLKGVLLFFGAALFSLALLKPKVIYFLLISLMAVDGFPALPGTSYGNILAIILTMGLMLRLAITREVLPKDDAYKYYYLFFAGSIASFAFSTDLSASVRIYITYISLFVFYVYTRYFIRTKKDIHDAMNYLFLSTISVFAINQIIGNFAFVDQASRISGGIGDANEFASFILVLLPLSFYRAISSFAMRKRIAYWGCFLVFLVLLIYSGSRGGVLGFLGASAVLVANIGFKRLKQIALSVIITATIFTFFVPDAYWERVSTILHPETEEGHAIALRENHYKAAVKMFLDYPLAGVGLYNFRFRNGDYGDSREQVVHNTYLEILTGGGLLSFIPFLFIVFNSWKKVKSHTSSDENERNLLICLKASFVSVLVTSFFFSGDHKKILWFLLALISSAYYMSMNTNAGATTGSSQRIYRQ